LLHKPFVYAAVSRFESQVAVFNIPGKIRSVNYRDLFPIPHKEHEIRNCEQAGVLGVLPGITGVMQANETIKLITGIGTVLNNKLLNYNALTNQFYEIQLQPHEDSQSQIPRSIEAFEATNYEFLCASEYHDFEIDTNQFRKCITDRSCCILDIREHGELPEVDTIRHRKIPLSQFGKTNFEIPEQSIVVFCQSGQRSILAVKLLNELFIDHPKNIYSLKGGINKWLESNS
jgi:sulfur-carrier protein adenylyltransferase/sulfurtransferase